MKNIIAKSKTTNLKIKVSYTDKHITKGTVLVGDAFNKVGTFDYWSTSTLIFEEIMKIKVGTKLVACYNLMLGNKFHLTNLKEYEVTAVDDFNSTFIIIDDQNEQHIFNFSDVPNVWFNFYKTKEDPIVKQVVDSFQERSKVGIEKYGTTLEENNTDDFLEHLQQELMDATLYIQKLKNIKPSLDNFSESEIVEYLRNNGYKVKYKL